MCKPMFSFEENKFTCNQSPTLVDFLPCTCVDEAHDGKSQPSGRQIYVSLPIHLYGSMYLTYLCMVLLSTCVYVRQRKKTQLYKCSRREITLIQIHSFSTF